MRVFEKSPGSKDMNFVRTHMGGTILASFTKGDGWDAKIIYGDEIIKAPGMFKRIAHVESWARGVLRKKRKR